MSKTCDTCNEEIDLGEYYHHCLICNDGDLDLCQSCIDGGKTCHDAAHVLERRLAVEYICPGCAYEGGHDQDSMQADVNCLDQYDFPDLPSRNAFRVLYLKKSPEDEPLKYTLHDRDYEQMKYHFVAVSYVCGDTTDLTPSICNGRLHLIYRNLDHALRRVRKALRQLFSTVCGLG